MLNGVVVGRLLLLTGGYFSLMNFFQDMNSNDPSGLIRMLDDFRSGTKLQYRRQSSTNLGCPFPLPIHHTPGKYNIKRPFDDTVLNENDMLIKRCKQTDSLLSDSSLNDSVGEYMFLFLFHSSNINLKNHIL